MGKNGDSSEMIDQNRKPNKTWEVGKKYEGGLFESGEELGKKGGGGVGDFFHGHEDQC